jgi:hypothetical protein
MKPIQIGNSSFTLDEDNYNEVIIEEPKYILGFEEQDM